MATIAGKYELLDRIGVGGMATVHRARQRGVAGFDRVVAIKQISRDLASKPEFTARFAREAQITSVLSHPSIIQIYDFGETTDNFFIAMEYVEGRSLLEIVQCATRAGMTIPVGVVLAIVRALCDALAHVHGRCGADGQSLDLVHRDITLANVVIARDGHLKLIDFGVATGRGFEPPKHAVVGKPSYIAPEVIKKQDGDSRIDVYAVGVIAWELLTGRPLFSGATTSATFRNVLHAEVRPPSTLRPEVPVEIDRIVMAALARDPAQRPASAAEIRDRLDRVHDFDSRVSTVAQWLAHWALAAMWTAPASTPPASTQLAPAAAALTPVRFQIHPRRSRLRVAAVAMALTVCGVLAIESRGSADGIPLATLIPPPRPLSPMTAAVEPPAVASMHESPAVEPRTVATHAVARPTGATSVRPTRLLSRPIDTTPRVMTREPRTVDPIAMPRFDAFPIPPVSVPLSVPVPEPSGPEMIRPDQVKRVSGAIPPLDHDRFATEHLGDLGPVTALVCIDEHGAVTSARVVGAVPGWVRDTVAGGLRSFRFTPYVSRGAPRPACFTRRLAVVDR